MTHQTNSPNRYIDIHRIHSRDWQFTTSKDTILATYCSTSGNMSSLATLVSEADACVRINSIDEWLSREFIPASTRLYGIEYIWLYDDSLGAVNSRSNLSSLLLSLDLDIAIGINSHIDIIDRRRSDEAVVDPFVHAHASRYREYHWQTHIEWALVCKECSHPCDRVRCIGECEFNLLLIVLEVSNIKLIPASIVGSDGSTSSPIEIGSIVATKCIAILNAKAEHDRLVGSYLEVELSNLFVGYLVD